MLTIARSRGLAVRTGGLDGALATGNVCQGRRRRHDRPTALPANTVRTVTTRRTGDWIEWENNSGYVEEIGLRVSRVRTFDNEHLTVPNSQLTDGVVESYDRDGTLRLKFGFRIGFDDDIDQARAIILEEARRAAGVLAEPEPSVKLVGIDEASFGLQSRV